MASLVQPYIDKENAPATGAAARKGRLQSMGARPTIGKTFGSENALKPQTPRQVLGNISNDRSTIRNVSQGNPQMRKPDPLQSIKKANLMKQPVGLSNRKSAMSNTPAQPPLQKKKVTKIAPPVFKLPTLNFGDNLPPIEQMNVFEDKDFCDGLPLEHCLSSHIGKFIPMRPSTKVRRIPSPPPFDASSLTIESTVRPLFEDEKLQVPMTEFEGCLQLPPVETLDFLDINNIKLYHDQD
ncbi:uncharacterized protein [Apostichopus japonicus]|uniref:uncharacterized protein n=1 Tax=Stichopus japonicus TaxID=307972 RepID=UPI003AB21703